MLTVKQGATLRCSWTYAEDEAGTQRISLEGLQARLQVRPTPDDEAVLDLDSATSVPHMSLLVEPLDENDEPLVGDVHLYLGATVTAALPAGEIGVGDLELYDPLNLDEVVPLTQEAFFVVADMTRP